jgi:hypothetical protein
MTISCLTVIIIFGYSQSMNEARDRRLEFFNEATIMCCVYHCIIFTPSYVDDPTVRYTMGYSMIFFTVFNILVNASVLLYVTISTTIRNFKIIRYKYRKWSLALKLKKQQKKN